MNKPSSVKKNDRLVLVLVIALSFVIIERAGEIIFNSGWKTGRNDCIRIVNSHLTKQIQIPIEDSE